jgi:HSP20 family protein
MTLLNRWDRWDPLPELSVLERSVDRLFRDAFQEPFELLSLTDGETLAPSADVYETPDSVQLRLEIPGIDEKDLSISVDNGVLTVRGERKLEEGEKEENFLRLERRYGVFSRSFTLPQTVDTDHISANYVNGVLRVELAKRPEAKPKRIPIHGGQKALGSGAKAA